MKKRILKMLCDIGYFMYRRGAKVPLIGNFIKSQGVKLFCWTQMEQTTLFMNLSKIMGYTELVGHKGVMARNSEITTEITDKHLSGQQCMWDLFNEGFNRQELAEIFNTTPQNLYLIGKGPRPGTPTEIVKIPPIKKGCEAQDGCFRRLDCLEEKGE